MNQPTKQLILIQPAGLNMMSADVCSNNLKKFWLITLTAGVKCSYSFFDDFDAIHRTHTIAQCKVQLQNESATGISH